MPTVKELHNKIRQHNASNCIKGYSSKKKATLVKIVSNLNTPTQQKQAGAGAGANKKKITPTLVSAGVGGGSSMSFGMPAGGGTEAQKKFEKKLKKQKKAYKKLKGKDANPELAF